MVTFWKLKTRILFTALVLFNVTTANAAICSRTLTFVDGAVLTASQLNGEFNAITNCANSLDNSNLTSFAAILPIKLDGTIADAAGAIIRNVLTGSLSVNVDGTTIEIAGNAAHLKDGSVTTAKIVDANVTTAKIADMNVTTAKIADASITQEKLAAGVNTAFLKSQVFTAASTPWVAPAGVYHVISIGCGGGGGGAGGVTGSRGGGGGGGSVSHTEEFTTIPGNTYFVDVGSGGSGGASGSDGVVGQQSDVNDGIVPLATFSGASNGRSGAGSAGAPSDVAHTPGGVGGGGVGAGAGGNSFTNQGGPAGTGTNAGGGGGAGDQLNGSGIADGASGASYIGTPVNGTNGSAAAGNTCAGGGGGSPGTSTSGTGGAGGSGWVKLMWVGP